jgi:hypothetical protein
LFGTVQCNWNTQVLSKCVDSFVVFCCNLAEIIGHYSGPEVLEENDIILTEKKVNFSMGAANPMDQVSPASFVTHISI